MKAFLLLGLVLLLSDGAPERAASRPTPPPHPFPGQTTDTLHVDTRQSVLRWKGTKFWGMGQHEGIVSIASGALYVRGEAILGGAFVIDMTTIKVTDMPESEPVPRKRLRKHLMDDDFFAVATYPTSRFVLTAVTPRREGTYRITGDLTLRGKTRPVTFDAEIPTLSSGALRATARFRINRQHWGVAYRGSRLTNDLVDDDIHLDLLLVATRRP